MNKNNLTRSGFSTRSTLLWFLDVGYQYGTMTEEQAFKISRVDRSTFKRWMNGESAAPSATMELLRLHAFGEPPCGFGKQWSGFRFQNSQLITDDGRSLTPADIKAVFFWKQMATDYIKLSKTPPFKFYDELKQIYQG